MKRKLINQINWVNLLLEITLMLFLVSFIYLFVPFQDPTRANTDEGLELIKAFLIQKGFSLYEPIWSDQPPIYTWLLSFWTQIFDKSFSSGRELTLLFSLLLLWSFRRIILIYFDQLTSIFAIVTLFFTKNYISLSVSVMQSIPSLSLGIFSLYFLITSLSLKRTHLQKLLLVISGILLGLAIQLKFWVVLLIAVSVFYLATCERFYFKKVRFNKKILNIFSLLSFWITGLIISIGLIIWLARPFPFEQLLAPHFNNLLTEPSELFRMLRVSGILRFDRILLFFAFIGLFLALLSGKKEINKIAIPGIWLSFDLILFWNHKPIWTHYYPIFSIPLVWLASYCFWWSWSTLRNINFFDLKRLNPPQLSKIPKSKILCYTLAIILIGLSLYSLCAKFNYFSKAGFQEKTTNQNLETLIVDVSTYQKQTHWIYTDNPLLAVRTNLLIPPEVAVITIKRLGRGGKYEQELLEVLQFYQPEQIIFMASLDHYRQLRFNPKLMSYIEEHYDTLTNNSEIQHHVLKNIIY